MHMCFSWWIERGLKTYISFMFFVLGKQGIMRQVAQNIAQCHTTLQRPTTLQNKLQTPLRKATFHFVALSHGPVAISVNAYAMLNATCLAMRCETSCMKNCTV